MKISKITIITILILIIPVIIVYPMNLSTPKGNIRIKIISEETNTGLKDVKVKLIDIDTFDTTNEDGYIDFKNIPFGKYELSLKKDGYPEKREEITVHSKKNNIELKLNKKYEIYSFQKWPERVSEKLKDKIEDKKIKNTTLSFLCSVTLKQDQICECSDRIIKILRTKFDEIISNGNKIIPTEDQKVRTAISEELIRQSKDKKSFDKTSLITLGNKLGIRRFIKLDLMAEKEFYRALVTGVDVETEALDGLSFELLLQKDDSLHKDCKK
ncbi:MAG: hypothetical protein HQK78_10730 [Desulfobacterales bacterium]|nr:hypothetical protein [Desulfobacterales bacterium]